MLALDLTGDFFVCHKRHLPLIGLDNSELQLLGTHNGLTVFQIVGSGTSLYSQFSNIPGFSLHRHLDKFYLLTPDESYSVRQQLLDSFFGLIASNYESLIDIERNKENIKNLISILQQSLDQLSRAKIIDYGCGTGLSLRVRESANVELIGVDSCPTMRQIAALRGMIVWSPGQLAQQPKDSLDGAFASYVFHLCPHTAGLRLLWSRLRYGGVFVANFHKGEGVKNVKQCIAELGGVSLALSSSLSEKHGLYLAYLKQ